MSINILETNYNAPEKTSNIKSVTSTNDTTLLKLKKKERKEVKLSNIERNHCWSISSPLRKKNDLENMKTK